MSEQKNQKRWLGSIDEIAHYGGVGRRTVDAWIASGALHVRRLSKRKLLCKPEDVDSCIEAESKRMEVA